MSGNDVSCGTALTPCSCTFILRADSLCVCDLDSFLMISTPLTGPELASFGGGRLQAPSSNMVCSLTVASQ